MNKEKLTPELAIKYAWKNRWDKIPVSELGDEFFDYRSIDQGDTILHAAANNRRLDLFDNKWLTQKRLSVESNAGVSVYYQAAVAGSLNQIPSQLLTKEILTKRYSDESTVLGAVIDNHHLNKFPKDLWTSEMLLKESGEGGEKPGGNGNRACYIHEIAEMGDLCYLPKEVLTREVIFKKDRAGNNVLFYATRMGELKYIPEAYLTKDCLMDQNVWGETMLHWAASSKRLKLIPKGLITKEALAIVNKRGETPIQVAIMCGCLDQIDLSYLTQKVMLNKNGKVASPIELLMSGYGDNSNEESEVKLFKSIIKGFDLEGLNKALLLAKGVFNARGTYEKEVQKLRMNKILDCQNKNHIDI